MTTTTQITRGPCLVVTDTYRKAANGRANRVFYRAENYDDGPGIEVPRDRDWDSNATNPVGGAGASTTLPNYHALNAAIADLQAEYGPNLTVQVNDGELDLTALDV